MTNNLQDYGPQYRKDPPFTARMRFHQSWYRAKVLQAPYGVGPKINNKTYYGNMLRQEDGEKGFNFLQPHIFEVAKRRVAETKGMVDRFRLLCNLLSSQPMCFNLFGPLVDDVDSATELFKAWLPGEFQQIDRVCLEYAPEPASEFLGDQTAFDAYVEYTRPDGKRAFIGFETKLTESFTQKPYAKPAYWQWTKSPHSPWPEESWPRLVSSDVNQIWRDHLLAVALQNHPRSDFAAGRFVVLYHPLDKDITGPLRTYQSLLKPDDQTFIEIPLDHWIARWEKTVNRDVDQEWLSSFRRRYLDLSASESDYREFAYHP